MGMRFRRWRGTGRPREGWRPFAGLASARWRPRAVILLKRLMGGVLRGISGAAELRHQAGCSGSVEEILAVFRKGTEGSDPAGE